MIGLFENLEKQNRQVCILAKNVGCYSNFHGGIELSYALTEAHTATINGVKFFYNPDEIAFCNPYDIHQFQSDKQGEHILFTISEKAFEPFQASINHISNHLNNTKINREILNIFQFLLENQKHLSPMEIHGYQSIILGIIDKHYGVSQKTSTSHYEDLRQVLEYLNKHYKEPLTRDYVASLFGYTPNYFSALFKSTLNIGFKEYLLELRYWKACELMKYNKYSKTNAILEVGFANMQSYYRIHKTKKDEPNHF